MFKKKLILGFFLCFAFGLVIAQPDPELKPIGDTGEEEAAARATYLTGLHNYNAKVNREIALSKVYQHHLDINRTNKKLGTSVTTQGIDIFFGLTGDAISVKKILVLSTNNGQTSSLEYLFDGTGDITYYAFRDNIMNPKSKTKSFYFTNKQMVYYAENGLVKSKADYGAELFNEGVEVINRALEYKSMLMALARIHPKG